MGGFLDVLSPLLYIFIPFCTLLYPATLPIYIYTCIPDVNDSELGNSFGEFSGELGGEIGSARVFM
jgi:hypothetical protein